jgi:uncharacterized protein YpmS
MERLDMDQISMVSRKEKAEKWRWVFFGLFALITLMLIIFFALYISQVHKGQSEDFSARKLSFGSKSESLIKQKSSLISNARQ